MIKIRSGELCLDVLPQQDISFTLENPLFADDHLPVGVSTNIEFALSAKNREVFGFVPTMLLVPKQQKLPAEILFNEVPMFSGELQFDDYSDGTLKYSFVTSEMCDRLTGNMVDIKFNPYKDEPFQTLVNNARQGKYEDFGLPLIIRKENNAKSEYATPGPTDPECSAVDKYANWIYTDLPYVVPAIKVKYLLSNILPDVELPDKIIDIVSRLAILGLYKNKTLDNQYGVETKGVGTRANPSAVFCTLDLADSLPDMSIIDFLINILKMLGCSLYLFNDKYNIQTNESVITSSSFVDWNKKIMDTYSITPGEQGGYILAFNNEDDKFQPKHADDLGQDIEAPIQTNTLSEAISIMQNSEEIINVKNSCTGDVYAGCGRRTLLYYKIMLNLLTNKWYVWWQELERSIYTGEIVHQEASVKKEIITEKAEQNYDNSIEFLLPPCAPTLIYTPLKVEGDVIIDPVGLLCNAPVVDFPTIGGERPSEVNIGLLFGMSFITNGNYFTGQVPYQSRGTEVLNNDFSLAINGEGGLYNTYHKSFAEWMQKKKCFLKADLNLSVADIANLQVFVKVMLCNQLFIIKSLEITLNTSSDLITTTGEFVES